MMAQELGDHLPRKMSLTKVKRIAKDPEAYDFDDLAEALDFLTTSDRVTAAQFERMAAIIEPVMNAKRFPLTEGQPARIIHFIRAAHTACGVDTIGNAITDAKAQVTCLNCIGTYMYREAS
jgi:hypothetical protein